MTGTQAAEKETPGSRADKLHRGRNVVLAFTMQVSQNLPVQSQARISAYILVVRMQLKLHLHAYLLCLMFGVCQAHAQGWNYRVLPCPCSC